MKRRNVYLEKLNAQIEQYNARLVGVGGEVSEAGADTRLDYISRVQQLESKIRATWNTVRASSWERMKEGSKL